jgi:hypothetical protein
MFLSRFYFPDNQDRRFVVLGWYKIDVVTGSLIHK